MTEAMVLSLLGGLFISLTFCALLALMCNVSRALCRAVALPGYGVPAARPPPPPPTHHLVRSPGGAVCLAQRDDDP